MEDFPDLAALHAELRKCRRCAEAGHPIESLPVFSGTSLARMMLIGQAPGVSEAESRRPFGGDAGRRLFRWLERAGWDETNFREACYITSVTKCFPGKAANGGGDRVPSVAEQKLCRPWLEAELAFVRPVLIIPVGMLAIRLFYPPQTRLDEIIGESIMDVEGRTIVPLPHPSGASRWHAEPKNVGKMERALSLLRTIRLDLDH
jgi:uracil-DNA glycosylase family 4